MDVLTAPHATVIAAAVSAFVALLATVVSATVSLVVLTRTSRIQRELKNIDERAKHYEISFQHLRLCLEQADKIILVLMATDLREASKAPFRATMAQLKVLLISIGKLTQAEIDFLDRKHFALDADFLNWRNEIVEKAYGKLFATAGRYRKE